MADSGVEPVARWATVPGRPPVAWRAVAVVAVVAVAVHLAVATRFGWHRDEFYYVLCGRSPAWGYVDQPPVAPVLARLAAALPGGVLPLRLVAIAAQAGCVLLTAVLAAEFGGRRRAQLLAAAATAASPVFVAASLLFGTTVLDQLAWVAVLVLVARALRLGSVRAYLAAGAVAGIGLETKDTIAVLLLGIGLGLALFRRDALRGPGPWLAGALAVLIAVPNLLWDARHQWANFHMAQVLAEQEGGASGALTHLPTMALLLAGPPLVGLWVLGVRRLATSAGRDHRWVLVATVVAVVVFTAAGGRPYYPAPALTALFAAGAVQVEAAATARGRIWWPAAVAGSGLLAVIVGLPVLPVAADTDLRSVNPQVMETYGWPSFVATVQQASAKLPAGTPIFTSNYGEIGALTILGPADGLRRPVFSGHNQYALSAPPGTPNTVLCVGQWSAAFLRRFWSQVTEVAPISLPHGLRDQETTQHAAVYVCSRPHGSWAAMWPGLRHLD
ncbi:glycosyltransferase family 39 protein [Catenulispora pinisilvae]|uniref:glycosyltransferase family 39 protein n=1 Tax=Catenulispora pinisilvae TaxID=2705253 RepID=UPI0018916E69|nr:glycosyltransferase family 39 protein [Catenulispora pinisilvae]